MIGQTLGHYRIDARIGAGGMGEVYKATDTRLDRIVAVKVLPAHFADNPDLKQRFEREAKAISSLNHPNICTLYDVGRAVPIGPHPGPLPEGEGVTGGTTSRQAEAAPPSFVDFLVMEYLEGDTLAQRLQKGELPLDRALKVAIEIADALDKAHRQGITHRDLKPGNIMLTKTGAKLLDFGLAKLRPPGTVGADGFSAAVTASEPLTGRGTILGTLQYMAPEQLEGKDADHRTDIFAFGAVVYEMVTGQRAFTGDSQASLIGAILKDEPPSISSLPTMMPAALDYIVTTCLAKEPDERWQSAADVGRQVRGIIEAGAQPVVMAPVIEAVPQPPKWRVALPWMLATLVAGAVGASFAVWSLTRPVPEPLARFEITAVGSAPFRVHDSLPDLVISPDGRNVAYLSGTRLRPSLSLRAVDQHGARILAPQADPHSPFFSPDGQWVGFWNYQDLRFKKASIQGGPAVEIWKPPDGLTPAGATWGADGTILFGSNKGLWRLNADGEVQQLTTANGQDYHGLPEMLPGGWVMFTIATPGEAENAQLAVVQLEGGDHSLLNLGGSHARYVSTGHLVYSFKGTLRAVRFDPRRREVIGEPITLENRVLTKTSGVANFDVAENGTLVYMPGEAGRTGTERTLVWVDRDGRPISLLTKEPATYSPWSRISPEGGEVAVTRDFDLLVLDAEDASLRPLTSDGSSRRGANLPVWTNDAKRLAFYDRGPAPNRILVVSADGSDEPTTVLDEFETQFPSSWAPGGHAMAFFTNSPDGRDRDIWLLPFDEEGNPEAPVEILATRFNERAAVFSPNGRWLAYVTDSSGQDEVLVRRAVPGPGSATQVSVGGGNEPVWARDGTELFYKNREKMMVVRVDTGPTFDAELPQQLFDEPYSFEDRELGPGWAQYDVDGDAQRFLMVQTVEPGSGVTQLHVDLNWLDELQRLVPVP